MGKVKSSLIDENVIELKAEEGEGECEKKTLFMIGQYGKVYSYKKGQWVFWKEWCDVDWSQRQVIIQNLDPVSQPIPKEKIKGSTVKN